MKQRNYDIVRGQKKIIILSECSKKEEKSPEVATTLCSGIHFFSQKKTLDMSGKKKQKKKSRFFLWGSSAFLCSLFVFAGVQGFEKKDLFASTGGEIKEQIKSGLSALKKQDFSEAEAAFSDANTSLSLLRANIEPMMQNSHFIQKGISSDMAQILELALALSGSGAKISVLAQEMQRSIPLALAGNFSEMLLLFESGEQELEVLQKQLQKASIIRKNFTDLPLSHEWKEPLERGGEFLEKGKKALSLLEILLPAAEETLGKDGVHTTALFFQNSSEIRATGGFPGSLALIQGEGGKVDFTFRDIYFFDWKNGTDFSPPPGFERLTKRLSLQDSNFSFDFPTSANRMRNMLEYSKGPTSETIVVINDQLFSEILKITGNIPLPGSDEILTPENAAFLLSFFVEAKLAGKHTPKDTLKNILPLLKERLQNLPPEKILTLIKTALQKKLILAHSTNETVQKAIEFLGIDGAVRNTKTADYLAVVSANVGGNKSDRYIQENLHLTSLINLKGEVFNTLSLKRTHAWKKEDDTFFAELLKEYGNGHTNPDLLKQILGAGNNHRYTEVFVPRGSVLTNIEGVPLEKVHTREEKGKTVFSFRFPQVSPGEKKEVVLHYSLPHTRHFLKKKKGNFDLYFQSQSGIRNQFLVREIVVESGLTIEKGEFSSAMIEGDMRFLATIE